MKKLLTMMMFGALLSVFGLSAGALDKAWFTDYKKAEAVAKEKKLPILALFTGSDWCPYCIKLEKEVLKTSAFKKATDGKFVLLYLDFPRKKELPAAQVRQNKELSGKYGVQGYPTTVVLNADGKVLGRIGGYAPAKAWFKQLGDIVKAK